MRIIITGATGMVGEGVLHECLQHPQVSQVLVVGRKSCQMLHPKLKELLVEDFFHLETLVGKMENFDACFFCLGVSSVGMREEDFTHLTYDLTLHFARTLFLQSPDLVFCYISGTGTDSTEKGRLMWARVKGKTENDLQKLGFKQTYLFRPGFLEPTPGLKNTLPYYKYVGWLSPILRLLFPGTISSLAQLGKAMIVASLKGYEKKIIEVKDIKMLANRL